MVARNTTSYVNEPAITGGNPILANNKVLFNDMLGSTLGVKDGNKMTQVAMTSFGETSNNDAFFTGKPMIGELGYAFLFRNYRADNGKWQTADPMGYPDGWNQLAYCNNEIINAIDFLGCASVLVSDTGTTNRDNAKYTATYTNVDSVAIGNYVYYLKQYICHNSWVNIGSGCVGDPTLEKTLTISTSNVASHTANYSQTISAEISSSIQKTIGSKLGSSLSLGVTLNTSTTLGSGTVVRSPAGYSVQDTLYQEVLTVRYDLIKYNANDLDNPVDTTIVKTYTLNTNYIAMESKKWKFE